MKTDIAKNQKIRILNRPVTSFRPVRPRKTLPGMGGTLTGWFTRGLGTIYLSCKESWICSKLVQIRIMYMRPLF